MMDPALVRIALWSFNICALGTIVECLRRYMCYVPKTIPLCSRLRVELVLIVIGKIGRQCLDFMLEGFAAKGWLTRDLQWQVQWDDDSRLYFFRCSLYARRRQKIDSSYLSVMLGLK